MQLSITSSCLLAALIISGNSHATERFVDWDLEPGVGQASLVMIARVSEITPVTVVAGAKTDVTLREYRFQPVRILKGIFQRDQLSMTASDLGCSNEGANTPSLKEGEHRLLILAQQRNFTSYGCVSASPGASTFEERVPLLSGPNDSLVGVVETLIKVANSRSRKERATLVIDRLLDRDVDGMPTVPLLTSLRRRADWAGLEKRAYEPLVRLTNNPNPAVRLASLETLRDMLATWNMPNDLKLLAPVGEALRRILESDEPNTRIRLAAIEAAGSPHGGNTLDVLIAALKDASTWAERSAAAKALSEGKSPNAIAAVLDVLKKLPLDEAVERETALISAVVKMDPAAAEKVLLDRLKRSMAARQSLHAEVEALGRMRSKSSLQLLLEAAEHPNRAPADHEHIVRALGRLEDDRAAPILGRWLKDHDYFALEALENLDSEAAAREARSSLKSEPQLQLKLRIARLLARHGMADGYALATEHLADQDFTASAALVLAAINDPRTQKDLSAVTAAAPDNRWHGAALVGLVATEDAEAKKQVLTILTDERHPLILNAIEAVGLTADVEMAPALAKLVQSRNRQIAMASLTALRRFLASVRSSPYGLAAIQPVDPTMKPSIKFTPTPRLSDAARETLGKAVASLAYDHFVDQEMRLEAFHVARLLWVEYERLADQPELEGTRLMQLVQEERRRMRKQAWMYMC